VRILVRELLNFLLVSDVQVRVGHACVAWVLYVSERVYHTLPHLPLTVPARAHRQAVRSG
jgi:hypothetical protein